MKSARSIIMAVACGLGLVLSSLPAGAGPKLEIDKDSWIRLQLLGQAHFSYIDDAADKEDFFLRRGRIIVDGQVMDGVTFFLETDNPNAGKYGSPAAKTEIQDAFLDVRMCKTDLLESWARGGLILLPFSFEDRSGAAKLLGIDYNSEVIKLVNHFNWRDYGAEIHGNVGTRFSYIAGAFDGYDAPDTAKDPNAGIRLTGHVALNLLGDAETGTFYTQERLGEKGSYLSLGLGGDSQNKATATFVTTNSGQRVMTPGTEKDSEAWVADFQSGFQAGPVWVTINGGYFSYDNSVFKGNTAFIEDGIMYGKTMLTTKYSLQDPDKKASTEDYTVGLHYFLKSHNARAGVEYRWGDSSEQVLVGLQFLL